MNGTDNIYLVNKMPLNQDIFLSNGFDETSYQKIKKTLLRKSNDPFQKTDVNKRLEEFFNFFSSLDVNLEDVRKGITLAPEFLTHTPTKINQNIWELSAYTGVSPKKLAGCLIKQPMSLTKNPKNIFITLQKGAQIWNIDFKTILSLSLKQPLLLTTPLSKFSAFKNFLIRHFELTEKEATKVFLKSPTLIKRNYLSLLNTPKQLAKIHKTDQALFNRIFLAQPTLFNLTQPLLSGKIKQLSNLFQISEEEIVKSMIKSPTLLAVSPKTILQNVQKTAKLFQVEEKEIITSFLKSPTLFVLNPNTLKQKLDFYHQMYLEDAFRLNGETKKDLKALTRYLLKAPYDTLANSLESLNLRRIYGLWLKEETGFSQMSPIWKRIGKISKELELADQKFFQKHPAFKAIVFKPQKER